MAITIETVLFDVDGTLTDSNDAHARAWVDALGEAGFTVPFERVRPLIGLGADRLLPELDLGLTAGDEPGATIVKRRREIFLATYLPTVRGLPGSRELLQRLRDDAYRCIVASSASEHELQPLLDIAQVDGLFEHAMKPEEVDASKPAPDIVLAALAWSKTAPERAVMVGDSRYDVEAANKAKVPVIALRCGGSGPRDLEGAAAIFDDPAALLRAIEADGFAGILR